MAKKTWKKQKLASSTTHSLFLPVTSSHSFSCFSASLQVQQFLLMLKKKKPKKHIKRNATGSNKRTPPSPHKRFFFFHPPRSLLPSQPVYFPTLYPTLFTTHLQIYLLLACHTIYLSLCQTLCFFFTTYLSLCQTLCFFFLLPTYLLFTISHSDDDEPGLFLFCQFCDDDDVHSWSGDHPYYDLARFGRWETMKLLFKKKIYQPSINFSTYFEQGTEIWRF